MTIAQDGTGNTMFQSGDSAFYTSDGKTVSCSGTGSDAKCTDLGNMGGVGAAAAGITAAFTGLYTGLTSLDKSVYSGHESSETIAGRDANCVTFKASDFGALAALASGLGDSNYDASAQAKICVDKETGFLLQWGASSDNGNNKDFLVATEVGESSPSDFQPPSTPETIPKITLPGGITVPGLNP